MAGEAVQAEAEKHAADIRCDLINPVQTIQALVIVCIGPQSAASRNVADRIIEGESCRETLRILRGRRNDICEHVVVWPVDFQPLFCPKVKLRFPRSEQLAEVIRPLVREFLAADQNRSACRACRDRCCSGTREPDRLSAKDLPRRGTPFV